jgi:hypothetical protein
MNHPQVKMTCENTLLDDRERFDCRPFAQPEGEQQGTQGKRSRTPRTIRASSFKASENFRDHQIALQMARRTVKAL